MVTLEQPDDLEEVRIGKVLVQLVITRDARPPCIWVPDYRDDKFVSNVPVAMMCHEISSITSLINHFYPLKQCSLSQPYLILKGIVFILCLLFSVSKFGLLVCNMVNFACIFMCNA